MEQALGVLSNQFASGGPISREQLVQAHKKIAMLEVQFEVCQKRAELAEYKWSMSEQVENEIKKRLDNVDRLYIETMEENMRLRDSEMELKNSFEGGADREQNNANLSKIANLEAKNEKLSHDVLKYKSIADIATQQASDLLRLHTINEKEKEILHAAIQELQIDGDEKLLIGKMHHHIVALQVSEANALRKLDMVTSKCLKLEANVVQQETLIDMRDSNIFQMHLDGKNRIRILQGLVSELRSRNTGLVLLSVYERTCNLVQSLHSRKTEMTSDLKKMMEDKKTFEDKLVESLEKIQIHEQLIAALQDKSSSSNIIMGWHKRMADNQLSQLKLQREVMHVKQSEIMAVKELEEANRRAAVLEIDIVTLQSNFDASHIDWEKREMELELKLQQYEEEREKIFQAATAKELKDALPDRTLPMHQQLEVALRLLLERTRLLAAQEIRIALLESQLQTSTTQVRELEDETLSKDFQLNSLKQTKALVDIDSGRIIDDTEHKFREMARSRESDAMKAAQGMIASLRRQLTQKCQLVEKYQGMIFEMREKMGKLSDNDKNEIQNLNATINDMSDKQIERLKNIHEVPLTISNKHEYY